MSFVTDSDRLSAIESIFGPATVHRDGVNVSVRCPNQECPSSIKSAQKRKFCIRLDDSRSHCWVCGLSGLLHSAIRRTLGRDVMTTYLAMVGESLGESRDEEHVPQVARLPADFRLLGRELHSTHDPFVRDAVSYLRRRDVSDVDIWRMGLGVSDTPEWMSRVLFPSFDAAGVLNFLVGRTTSDRTRPKYFCSVGVDKTSVVFNEVSIDWSQELTVVEGPFDLMRCEGNATCLLGSSMSDSSRLFKMITSHRTPVCLALDADMVRRSHDIARRLSSLDVRVRVMSHPDGVHDVGEMDRRTLKQSLDAAKFWTWESHIMMRIGTVAAAPSRVRSPRSASLSHS